MLNIFNTLRFLLLNQLVQMQDKPKIEEIVRASIEPMVVFELPTYQVAFLNEDVQELFSLSIGKEKVQLRHFCSRADVFNERSAIELFERLPVGESVLYDWPVRLGKVRWLSAFIYHIEHSGNRYIAITFRDNTIAKESLLKLDNMITYREMLDKLLSYSTNVNISEIPQIIDQSLEMVGKYFACDRSYVFQYSEDLRFKSNINEWCNVDVDPYIDQLQNIPINAFPYLKECLLNMEVVCFDDVNDLPIDAFEEREEFAKESIQSILLIPFGEENKPIGFIGLDHVNIQKKWSESEVLNLKLLARTFANMLVRARSEKRIIDNRNMYQMLFETAGDGMAVFKGGKCVDINPKALLLLRCTINEVIGKSGIELSSINQSGGKSPTYANVYINEAEKGFPQTFEWTIKRFDGSEFDAEVSLKHFESEGDNLVIAIFKDITQHEQAVKALIDNQLHFKEISEKYNNKAGYASTVSLLSVFELDQLQRMQDAFSFATGISSLITNIDGQPITKVSFSNNVCIKVRSTAEGQRMCMESSRCLGEKAREVLAPVSRPCLSCGFIDAAAPIVVDGHHIGNWLIGQVRPDDLNVERLLEYTRSLGLADEQVLKDFDNLIEVAPEHFDKILNLLNVLTKELSALGYNNLKLAKTINEHVDLERKLRQAKQNAEESDRLKSAFLANLSHEIRTPMNGIVGFSELLQYDGLTPDDRREYVRLIHQSSSQLLNIINDIIDISKIESGQIDVRSGYFDLIKLGTELEGFFMDDAERKGVGLVFVNRESADMEVLNDEVKLRQVLTNLISNAIKFTAKGQVEFGYHQENDGIEVFVQDSGIGIDAEDVDFIFDRFWQAKDSDVKKGGTGLGLAITKAYVELLGGHIKVESNRNIGTRFSFIIPKELK